MVGKLFTRTNLTSVILFVVQCLTAVYRMCSGCNQIVFSIQQGLQDRILEDSRDLKSVIVKSDTECFVECVFDCRCMSFTVCRNSCHLSAGSRNLVRGSLRRKLGCRYYDFLAFEVRRYINRWKF